MTLSTESSIEIREIDSFREMDACVNLQQSVWQFPDLDLIPRRMFVVARAVGGQIFGAWDGPQLAGYALAIPGMRNGQSYLHSHMLAVSPQYRNRGIGAQLKFAQRENALSRGIDLIEWTFDPLQIKNAHFNLEKLGAIVCRYAPDFYGPSTSPVHGALPTDRLHAEWWLKSKRVESLMAGKCLPEYSIKDTVAVTNIATIQNDKAAPPAASGLELLLQVRRRFISAFSTGLVALGFETAHDGTARYLLGVPCEGEQRSGVD